ncbi:MAG: TAXI family TRAP transporter solute-binding subunit [Quadrisphaera sp.]
MTTVRALGPAPRPSGPSRRQLVRGLGSVLGAVVLAGAAAPTTGCSRSAGPALRIATGEQGGFYAEFGALLVDALERAGQPAVAVTTGGSADNLARVCSGDVDVGLALADSVDAAAAGGTGSAEGADGRSGAAPLVALGRVYENYLQLVVLGSSPARSLADLAGRRVSLGGSGSGASLTSARLLAATGVVVDPLNLPLVEAVAALDAGGVDAVLWSGGVPTPAVAPLRGRIRLLPLADGLSALRRDHGDVYRAATVRAGAYGDQGPVATVGVANLLVALPALPDGAAARVAEVLVLDRDRLVPSAALGAQYLDSQSVVEVGPVELHPGAVAAYRRLHG